MEKVIKNPGKSKIKSAPKSVSKKETDTIRVSSDNDKREFILEGLDCANCASKIEDKVSKINGISSANVNFLTKTLTLEIEEINKAKELIAATADVIKKIESDVKLVEKNSHKTIKKTLMLDGLG